MKDKSKIIVNLCMILVLISVLSVSSFAASPTSVFMREWGLVLTDNAIGIQRENVYAMGKNAVVTNQDIDQAAEFYRLSGMDERSAREEAVKYMLQREALYQAAIENGYSVTDEEIWDYLEELKEAVQKAGNREDAEELIRQFESEEDYWNYLFIVYQKNLPSQNYVHDLEQAFMQSDQDESSWDQYFEQMKEELVQKEDYQILHQ